MFSANTAVIFDIDGCLAHIDGRHHLVRSKAEGSGRSWHEFNEQIYLSQPMSEMKGMFYTCIQSLCFVNIHTAKLEVHRTVTLEWLQDCINPHITSDRLRMRQPKHLGMKAHELKRIQLNQLRSILRNNQSIVAFDDSLAIHQMYLSEGVTSFLIQHPKDLHEGYR